MQRLLNAILIGASFTFLSFICDIIFPNLEAIITPKQSLLILIFRGVAIFFCILALLVMPIAVIFRIIKKKLTKFLTILVGFTIGVYIGIVLYFPINNWDEMQRDIAGEILFTEIEIYYQNNGVYPTNFNKLDKEKLDKLPKRYPIERFSYERFNGDYQLIVNDNYISLDTDICYWNREKKEFEYISYETIDYE